MVKSFSSALTLGSAGGRVLSSHDEWNFGACPCLNVNMHFLLLMWFLFWWGHWLLCCREATKTEFVVVGGGTSARRSWCLHPSNLQRAVNVLILWQLWLSPFSTRGLLETFTFLGTHGWVAPEQITFWSARSTFHWAFLSKYGKPKPGWLSLSRRSSQRRPADTCGQGGVVPLLGRPDSPGGAACFSFAEQAGRPEGRPGSGAWRFG